MHVVFSRGSGEESEMAAMMTSERQGNQWRGEEQ